jgi:hypothetical protein
MYAHCTEQEQCIGERNVGNVLCKKLDGQRKGKKIIKKGNI